MGKPLKRINTYSEIFESEKNYLNDLNLWAKTFRRHILTTDCISPQRRLVINRGIFANIDNIVELHTRILHDMAQMNEECRVNFVREYCEENGYLFDDIWEQIGERNKDVNSGMEYFIGDDKGLKLQRGWSMMATSDIEAKIMNNTVGKDVVESLEREKNVSSSKNLNIENKLKNNENHINERNESAAMEDNAEIALDEKDKKEKRNFKRSEIQTNRTVIPLMNHRKATEFKFNFNRDDIYQSLIVNTDEEARVYSNLRYEDIYEKYLKGFDMYRHYIHKMPRMQHLIERELQINPRFVTLLNTFFAEHDIRLGYLNFIFRPSQKLMRYPLLLKNIKKYAMPDDEEIEQLNKKQQQRKEKNLKNLKDQDISENDKKSGLDSGKTCWDKEAIIKNKLSEVDNPTLIKNDDIFQNVQRVIDCVDRLISYLSEKSQEADVMLKDGNNQFEMYKLFLHTEYAAHVRPRTGLGLFLRERKKIIEIENVLVRSTRHYDPKYFTVVVMDHLVMICDVVDQGFYKRYNVIDNPLATCKWHPFNNTGTDDPENKYFRSQFSIIMNEIDGKERVYFYFNDEKKCNQLLLAIIYSQGINEERYDLRIKINEMGSILDSGTDNIEEMVITDFLYIGNNIDRNDEERLGMYMNEVELLYNENEDSSENNYELKKTDSKNDIDSQNKNQESIKDDTKYSIKNFDENHSIKVINQENYDKNKALRNIHNSSIDEIKEIEKKFDSHKPEEAEAVFGSDENKFESKENNEKEKIISKIENMSIAHENNSTMAKDSNEKSLNESQIKQFPLDDNNKNSERKINMDSFPSKEDEKYVKNALNAGNTKISMFKELKIPESYFLRENIIREIVNPKKEKINNLEENKDTMAMINKNINEKGSEIVNMVDETPKTDTEYREFLREKRKKESVFDNKYLLGEGDCIDFVSTSNHKTKVDYTKEKNKIILRESKRFVREVFEKNEPRNDDQFLCFFSTARGIFMKNRTKITQIYKNRVTDMFYIRKRQILCFLEDTYLKYAKVGHDIELINPIILANKIFKFFYGLSQGKELLIVSLYSSVSSSFLHLYELKIQNGLICFELATMLYIGGEIHSLMFYGDKIITCCREIDIIDLKTLRVQSMLDSTDIALKMFCMDFIETKCRNVFRVRANVYLIVNDKVGFIVDEFGSIFDRTLYFVWYDEPTDFKLFDRYLIVLNAKSCVTYDCETGWIISYLKIPNLKFVKGCSYNWVHDDNKVYEISFPSEVEQKVKTYI